MLREQTLECTICLVSSPDKKKIEATAHLLEYEFDRFFPFWFGVANTCVPAGDEIQIFDKIMVEFEDGRKGMATAWDVHPRQGVFCLVPFVGVWPLQ